MDNNTIFDSFNYENWCDKFKILILKYRYAVYFMQKYNTLGKDVDNYYNDFVILNQIPAKIRGPTVSKFLHTKITIRNNLIKAIKSKFDEYYKESNDIKIKMNIEKKALENETNLDTAKTLILNVSAKLKNNEPGLEKDKLSPSTQDFYSSMTIENIKKEKEKMFAMGKEALSNINVESFFEYDKHFKFLDNLEKEFNKKHNLDIKENNHPQYPNLEYKSLIMHNEE